MKKAWLWLLMLFFVGRVLPVEASLGTVGGYLSPSTNNVRIGDKFSTKIMFDAGTNKLSSISLGLGVDTTKVKVEKVSLNPSVFNGLFLNEESGGVVSLFGTISKPRADLPIGVFEVGTISMEAVAAGTVSVAIKTFEVVGPSTTNDYNYGLNWQKGSIIVTSDGLVGNGTDGVLKFKTTFAGVVSSAQCASNWSVGLSVMRGTSGKSYKNVPLTPVGEYQGRKVYEGQVTLTGLVAGGGLGVFLKGPRHLQMKYGVDDQVEFYNQSEGKISVTASSATTPVHDFTKYPLMAGDVTGPEDEGQDGVVDGLDFSYVKTEVNKRLEGDNMLADLNGNCKLESQDLTLLMLAMKDKQEQLY